MNHIVAAVIQKAEETNFDPNKVSPGVEGFIFTGLMAAAIITLGFLLVKRLRRNAYRHEVQEQIAEELRESGASDGADGAAGGDPRN